MAVKINGVHHIALKCVGEEEFKKTVEFYRDILNLKVIRSWGEGDTSGIMLSSGDAMMEILANATEASEGSTIRHFAYSVDDTDECVRSVREAGYEITIEPKNICIKSNPEYPARIAFCKGPLGEEIEFFQEL